MPASACPCALTSYADKLTRAAPLVRVRLHDARLTVRVGDLLDFGGVFDRVALGVLVVGKQLIAEQVATRDPGARNAAFTRVEHGLDPFLPVAHLECRVMEARDTLTRL